MNNVFVYCETEGTNVADVSLELLTKGRKLANQLGCGLEAIVAGSGLEGVEKQVLPFGVDKVHVFDAPGSVPLYVTSSFLYLDQFVQGGETADLLDGRYGDRS